MSNITLYEAYFVDPWRLIAGKGLKASYTTVDQEGAILCFPSVQPRSAFRLEGQAEPKILAHPSTQYLQSLEPHPHEIVEVLPRLSRRYVSLGALVRRIVERITFHGPKQAPFVVLILRFRQWHTAREPLYPKARSQTPAREIPIRPSPSAKSPRSARRSPAPCRDWPSPRSGSGLFSKCKSPTPSCR
jgi:hypothetical protein